MLKEDDLFAWFATQGITIPFSHDQVPATGPNRVHILSITGGLGETLEEEAEQPTFQVLTRGVNGGDAIELMTELDQAWMNANPGFDVGGYWLIRKGRLAGATQGRFVSRNPNNGYVFRSNTYWCEIER